MNLPLLATTSLFYSDNNLLQIRGVSIVESPKTFRVVDFQDTQRGIRKRMFEDAFNNTRG